MDYYYVKSGGTASLDTGRTVTKRTGLWNAATVDYYNSLEACIAATTVPTDGDFILFSDLHALTYALAADLAINGSGSLTGVGLTLASVDNANQENYRPGASEDNTAAYDYTPKYNVNIAGVDLKGADDTLFTTFVGANITLQDNVLTNGGGAADHCLRISGNGILVSLTNVELASTGTVAELLYLSKGAKLIWNGGKVSGTMPGELFVLFGQGGGATALLTGVDLSLLDKPFFPNLAAGNVDVCLLRLTQCQLHASVVVPTSANMGRDRKSTRLNSSHIPLSRMPSSA